MSVNVTVFTLQCLILALILLDLLLNAQQSYSPIRYLNTFINS